MLQSFGSGASVTSSENVVTVPDTAFTTQCASECCACNTAAHQSAASATRTRHYDILGGITVTETVEFSESGSASENSQGADQKAVACITTNESGSGSAPGGDCICVCLPEPTVGPTLPPTTGGPNPDCADTTLDPICSTC